MGREDIEIIFFFPSEERSGRELNGKIVNDTPVNRFCFTNSWACKIIESKLQNKRSPHLFFAQIRTAPWHFALFFKAFTQTKSCKWGGWVFCFLVIRATILLGQCQGLRALAGSKRRSPQLLAICASSENSKQKPLQLVKKNGSYCTCPFSVLETSQSSCGAGLKDHSSEDDNRYYVVTPK